MALTKLLIIQTQQMQASTKESVSLQIFNSFVANPQADNQANMNNIRDVPTANQNNNYRAFHGPGVRLGGN
jgi:hypothetical protein